MPDAQIKSHALPLLELRSVMPLLELSGTVSDVIVVAVPAVKRCSRPASILMSLNVFEPEIMQAPVDPVAFQKLL